MRRRITITPGPGAYINGLPSKSGFWQGNSVIVSGDFDFEVEDLESYVVVKTAGYSGLTYRDPSDTLKVGDHVMVPLGWKDTPTVGEVVAHGRNGYSGPTKDVSARLEAVKL